MVGGLLKGRTPRSIPVMRLESSFVFAMLLLLANEGVPSWGATEPPWNTVSVEELRQAVMSRWQQACAKKKDVTPPKLCRNHEAASPLDLGADRRAGWNTTLRPLADVMKDLKGVTGTPHNFNTAIFLTSAIERTGLEQTDDFNHSTPRLAREFGVPLAVVRAVGTA